jgi:hypothetical protein
MMAWDGPEQPELRAKLRAMLEASATIDQPSADDRQRVRARLAAVIAAGALPRPSRRTLPLMAAAHTCTPLRK